MAFGADLTFSQWLTLSIIIRSPVFFGTKLELFWLGEALKIAQCSTIALGRVINFAPIPQSKQVSEEIRVRTENKYTTFAFIHS